MIGKRIILYLVGISALLGVTIFAVVTVLENSSVVTDGRVVSADISKNVPELADTEDKVDMEIGTVGEAGDTLSKTVGTLDIVLTEVGKKSVGFADLFAVSGSVVVGKDSRTGQLMTYEESSSYQEITEDSSLVSKNIKISSIDKYDDTVSVFVVGVEEGEYSLSGKFIDTLGNTQSILYTFVTSEAVVDEFEFDYNSGEISVKHQEYYGEDTSPDMTVAQGCDVPGLTRQLEDELEKIGWDIDEVPRISTSVFRSDKLPNTNFDLPFESKDTCMVTTFFRNVYQNSVPEYKDLPSFIPPYSYDKDFVIVGGKKFGHSPADGPLSSSDIFPITKTGNELQLLELVRVKKIVSIGFPMFSVCPCVFEYRATLTDTMSPD